MSSDVAISVRGLCKSYTIAHDGEKHFTLADSVLSRLRRPFQRPKTETLWARKEVNFESEQGDVIECVERRFADVI